MKIPEDYLFKIIGMETVRSRVLEEENNMLKDRIKNLEEEKEVIQKSLKQSKEITKTS